MKKLIYPLAILIVTTAIVRRLWENVVWRKR